MKNAMLRYTINAAKDNFFDAEKVLKKLGIAQRRVLSRYGAFVRTRAKTSLRYKQGPSEPGKPPHAHKGNLRVRKDKKTGANKWRTISLLREYIFFGYESDRETVVVGPALLNSSKHNRSRYTVPELLEHGGTRQGDGREVMVTLKPGRNRTGQFTSRKETRRLDGTLTYKPRPYMQPAADAEKAQLLRMMKDMI